MALDRQSIQKRDFPIGSQGYDPGAVDEHLAMLADQIERLHHSVIRSAPTESLATAASERVRLIVEAAEQSAGAIVGEAELEASQIREDARTAAETARSEAAHQVLEQVDLVSETANVVLQRADELEGEFQGLLESVRTSGARLSQELQGLQATVGELRSATEAHAPSSGNGGGDTRSEDPEATSVGSTYSAPGDPAPAAPTTASASEYSDASLLASDPSATRISNVPADDEEGARLSALNMALNGTPREETARYLADRFGLVDTEAILDDVYDSAR